MTGRGGTPPLVAAALLAFSSLCWAGNIVLGRAVHAEIPPVGMNFWRWAVALALLLLFTARPLRRNWPAVRREWKLIVALGVIGMALFHSMLYLALATTTAINAALILAITPVAIAILSRFILGERLGPRQAAGTVLSLAGVGVIVTRADAGAVLGLRFAEGDVVMVFAMLAWALYSVLVKRRPVDLHPRAMLSATVIVAVAALLPVYLWESAAVRPLHFTWATVATIAYIAVFASVLAFMSFNHGIEVLGPNRGGLFMHLIPVFTTLLAILFLAERLQTFHVAGIAAIASGLYLSTAARRSPPTLARSNDREGD